MLAAVLLAGIVAAPLSSAALFASANRRRLSGATTPGADRFA